MIPLRDRLPTRTVPFVNYAIIALNLVAFLYELAMLQAVGENFILQWGFMPGRFMENPSGEILTVFSSMFLHGGWMHILGNMLFLWVFGDNVEDALGHFRYVLFYLVGGVAAAGVQMIIEPSSMVPMIGASGAISAVLAGYVSMYPRARVLVLFPIFILITFFEFPAWLVILEWFVLQLISGFSSLAAGLDGGVAWFAHIGGFVAGLILVRLLMVGRERQSYDPWHGWRTERQMPGSRRMVRRQRTWWEH